MKIVLFDIDDTLTNSGETNGQASEVMFRTVFNVKGSEDMIDKWGKTEKGIIQEVLHKFGNYPPDFEVPNEAFITWAAALKELYKTNPPKVFLGIKELLEALSKEEDVQIGLLTGNSRIRAEIKLKAVDLEKYFMKDGVLVGVFGDISSKRGNLIPHAREKYGEGIYILVDDSITAAKAAKENNIASILVATGNAKAEQLKEYTSHVFSDFGEGRWEEAVEVIRKI